MKIKLAAVNLALVFILASCNLPLLRAGSTPAQNPQTGSGPAALPVPATETVSNPLMPTGFLIAPTDRELQYYTPSGAPVGSRIVIPTGLRMLPEQMHAAGGMQMMNPTQPPVMGSLMGEDASVSIEWWNPADDQWHTIADAANITGIASAPAQAVMVFTTAEVTPDGASSSRGVEVRVGAEAVVLYGPTALRTEGYVYSPLGVDVSSGLDGVWITERPYGIGGDIVFEPSQALLTYNQNTAKMQVILDEQRRPVALSKDRKWAASVNRDDKDLQVLNMQTGQSIPLPVLPASDRGAGLGVFSPDDNLLAWMEGSGFQMSETPNFMARVRVSDLNGKILYDQPMSAYQPAAPWQMAKAYPVGWLDGSTLLVELINTDWDAAEILAISIPDGKIKFSLPGWFVETVYLPK
jgi:hypothetical protein